MTEVTEEFEDELFNHEADGHDVRHCLICKGRRRAGFALVRPVVAYRPPAVDVIGQQTLVSYLEGRPTIEPDDPLYGLQRRAIEELMVAERVRDVRQERELRRLLASGQVSRWQLALEFARRQ